MKKHPYELIGWLVLVILLVIALAWPFTTMGNPSENTYDPPAGQGPLATLGCRPKPSGSIESLYG